jgi:hypothetical protein
MKPARRFAAVVVLGILTALPHVASTQQDPAQNLVERTRVTDGVEVQFGDPTQTGPASRKMVPNEVTISKRDTVTFHVNGVGHGIAIYPVSKNTTREHIASQLCDGVIPGCSAMAARDIRDGSDRVVITIDSGGQSVWIDSQEGQLVSVNSRPLFLVGGTVLRVRFHEHGRYLAVCMNRAHTVNDAMFGFINVEG